MRCAAPALPMPTDRRRPEDIHFYRCGDGRARRDVFVRHNNAAR
jgi:hypothetical protein